MQDSFLRSEICQTWAEWTIERPDEILPQVNNVNTLKLKQKNIWKAPFHTGRRKSESVFSRPEPNKKTTGNGRGQVGEGADHQRGP